MVFAGGDQVAAVRGHRQSGDGARVSFEFQRLANQITERKRPDGPAAVAGEQPVVIRRKLGHGTMFSKRRDGQCLLNNKFLSAQYRQSFSRQDCQAGILMIDEDC